VAGWRAAVNSDERTELHRKARWQFTRAEQALDLAITALRRLEQLSLIDGATRDEFTSDIELLRGKLATLQGLLA
jgi:hypothetical protein